MGWAAAQTGLKQPQSCGLIARVQRQVASIGYPAACVIFFWWCGIYPQIARSSTPRQFFDLIYLAGYQRSERAHAFRAGLTHRPEITPMRRTGVLWILGMLQRKAQRMYRYATLHTPVQVDRKDACPSAMSKFDLHVQNAPPGTIACRSTTREQDESCTTKPDRDGQSH